ncbi:uncharacterized protein LOC107399082 [Tribolium castaneum]|nr:PREDICTED: uncharacterized protein LOC107399082 isoform X1 [Tribolium castaneum]|eukprot:XP_015840249.1 PREDICTED: uncharacterized protein LOC107399082 isoform X1 [Tribolium castaneum]
MKFFIACWSFWGFVRDMQVASFTALGFRGTADFVIACFDVNDVIVSAIFFVTSTPFKFKHFVQIVENFDRIDARISPILVEQIRKRSNIFVKVLVTFLPTLYVLDLFMWGKNNWEGLNNYFAFYIMYSIVVVHELQYWHIMTMMYARILGLNKTLRDYFKNKTGFCEHEILVVTQSFNSINDSVEEINKCFSYSTTTIIFSCYIHLVISPYQLFVVVSSTETSLFNYVYLLWISLHIMRVLTIVEVCQKCENENRKTRSLVYQLLLCKLNEKVKNMVRVLFFLVTTRKILFSAYALPKINRRLIISILSSISTYWMILMQSTSRTIQVV